MLGINFAGGNADSIRPTARGDGVSNRFKGFGGNDLRKDGPDDGGAFIGGKFLSNADDLGGLFGCDVGKRKERFQRCGVDVNTAEVELAGIGGDGIDGFGPIAGFDLGLAQGADEIAILLEFGATIERLLELLRDLITKAIGEFFC